MKHSKGEEPLDVKAVNFFENFIILGDTLPTIFRYPVGAIITVLGIIMLVLPGPGFLFLLGGFVVINKRFGLFMKRLGERYVAWRMRKK